VSEKLQILDLGRLAYRAAWDRQLEVHARVLSGELAAGAILLVEHPPVITIGRRANAAKNLLASPGFLASRGVEVVETDRGGDVTFHGPGQLVAYPILNLNAYRLNLHAYMRLLEEVVIATLGEFGIEAQRDSSPTPATGVWVEMKPGPLSKICALGVKLRRWVTLHGLALNVTTDLSYFELINPCGLSRPVTSMERVLAASRRPTPGMQAVKDTLAATFQRLLPSAVAGPCEPCRAPGSLLT
jgi:lipoyl(octanoyl) transferase